MSPEDRPDTGLPAEGASEGTPAEEAPVDSPDTAAASALARAREAAKAKGLRPGRAPQRREREARRQRAARENRDGYRDPSLLGEQMERLLLARGWNVDVAVGSVMGRWAAIVGPHVAAHVTPVTFEDGVLTVRADSTAWATQMRLMASSLLTRLETEVGQGAVTELTVLGPSAPSWSRGPRRAQGPGPRDTYG